LLVLHCSAPFSNAQSERTQTHANLELGEGSEGSELRIEFSDFQFDRDEVGDIADPIALHERRVPSLQRGPSSCAPRCRAPLQIVDVLAA
jgi:hypothetical protein